LAPFISNQTNDILKVRNTVTFFNDVGAMYLGKKNYGVPINGANPNGLIKNYFNERFYQSTQYFD
jgi:hypothetical protein